MLFLIGLVVMYFFSITPVTASAAATLFGVSALYCAVTGVPYFVDSEIPSAVFLGLHLLVTDPSTSPRTPLGRVIFGVPTASASFALYALLGALGAADVLRQAAVRAAAEPARARRSTGSWRAIGERPLLSRARLSRRRSAARNLAHMAVWVGVLRHDDGLGRTDGMHRGDALPFWQQACAEGRPQACERLLRIEASLLRRQRGVGVQRARAATTSKDAGRAGRSPSARSRYFSRACEGRFQAGCVNLLDPSSPARANPRPSTCGCSCAKAA